VSERRDFFEAIRAGDVGQVRALVAEEPGLLFAAAEDGGSPLLVALWTDQLGVAQTLLDLGGEIGFAEAVALGEREAVAEGLALDPGLGERRSGDGYTPLQLAVYFARPEVVELLLAAGADVEAVAANAHQVRALHAAVGLRDEGVALALVERLLGAGAAVDAVQAGGFTPLLLAAARGRAALVERLLAHGADPTWESDGGQTAASLAAARGHQALAASLATRAAARLAPAAAAAARQP
jgi:ankyrin repeat protein